LGYLKKVCQFEPKKWVIHRGLNNGDDDQENLSDLVQS